LCLMALASLTRAEYSPWLAVFGLLVAAQAKGPFAIWRRAWIVLLAITPFVVGVAHPDFRARSWLAFKQHYGQKAQVEALEHEWRESQGNVSPQRIQEALHELEMSFAEPDRWIAKDFGAAGSPLEALSANPKRFLWHVSNVIGGLPLSLAIAFSAWFAPWLHYSWLSLMICVLAAFGWGLPVGPARMLCVGAMMHVKLLLVCSPLALLASLMVGARPELALPVVPAIMVCVGGGVVRWITLLTQSRASKAGCDPCPTLGSESEAKPVAGVGDWIDVGLRRSPARHGSGAESAALATVAAVVGLVGMLVGGPFRDPDKPTAYRDGLTLLESGLPAEAKRVLTNYWRMPLRLIHRPDLQPIWPSLGPTDSLSVFLQQHRVDAIHVNPALLFQLRNVPDAFQAVQGGGWRLAGQKGSSMLYVREPL
jgi:hypothetical protein